MCFEEDGTLALLDAAMPNMDSLLERIQRRATIEALEFPVNADPKLIIVLCSYDTDRRTTLQCTHVLFHSVLFVLVLESGAARRAML